ncbi:MAG TPA: hypothetical protein VGM41_03615 [Chitinophagaceae bacterium]|jgi:hypothetical protein
MKCILLSVAFIALACTTLHAQDTTGSHQYVGKYMFPDGSVVPSVEVTLDNGALSMSSTAGTSPLQLLGKDSFSLVTFNGYAVFRRNGNDKIMSVHIEASGYVLEGARDTTGLHHDLGGWMEREGTGEMLSSQHFVQEFLYHPVISKEGKKDEYYGGR